MDTNSNSFWQRKEGTTAKIILGGIGAACLYGLYVVLPFLITIAENTLYLGFLIGAIVSVYLLLTSERAKSLLFFALQAVSRAITGVFVNVDPVGILQSFVKDLQNKRKTVQEAIGAMRETRSKAALLRATKIKEMNESLKLADVAEQSGNTIKLQELTERVGRRQKAVENLDTNIAFADESIKTLTEVDGLIEYHINNSTDEMNDLKNDNEMALSMIAASRAANAALGDSDKLDIKNMAAEVIRDRVAKATGQIETLMVATHSMKGDMDLTNLSFQADGKAKLAEMRKNLASIDRTEAPITQKALTAGPATSIVTSDVNKWATKVRRNNN